MALTDAKIAIKSLRATKLRTGLTMLGIIIGVASVTIVMSLGEGAKQKIRDQVDYMGTNLITIRPGQITQDSNGNVTGYNLFAALGSSTISEYDLDTVKKNPNITGAAPIMAITGTVADNNHKPITNTSIIATDSSCEKVLNFKIRSGEFINDITNRETVILGHDLAIELLGTDQVLGQQIFLRGKTFTVIGILAPYEVRTSFSNLFDYNRTAFIPLDAGKAFNQGIAQIQLINVRTDNNIKDVAQQLNQQVLKNHGNQEDFAVLRPEQTIQITDTWLQIITALTTAVASISLIVGGIGIMNIMLVSVTERTREIGIRKAVGATNMQILRQFLIEALFMSLVGGLFGIAIAYGLAFLAGTLLEITPVITVQIVAISLGIATLVGVIFGIVPAIKAARKNPIDALRFFQ
ncbi:MAG: ABC transporter permease [Candidatus Woesebacteria bacterium]|jgi:ABC-type antimicrobial peptide transport system permease subunit